MSEKEDVELANATEEVVAAMLGSFGIKMETGVAINTAEVEEEEGEGR